MENAFEQSFIREPYKGNLFEYLFDGYIDIVKSNALIAGMPTFLSLARSRQKASLVSSLSPADHASSRRITGEALQFIKGGFLYRAKKELGFNSAIWEAGFTNHGIGDSEDYRRHRAHIRENPVKANLVDSTERYPYSSALADRVRCRATGAKAHGSGGRVSQVLKDPGASRRKSGAFLHGLAGVAPAKKTRWGGGRLH